MSWKNQFKVGVLGISELLWESEQSVNTIRKVFLDACWSRRMVSKAKKLSDSETVMEIWAMRG